MKKITVLGSTGSVGRQALDVALSSDMKVIAIAAGGRGSSAELLEEQIRRFRPALCAVADEAAARDLAVRAADTDTKIIGGAASAEEAAAFGADGEDGPAVVNAVSGFAGLRPTLAAIRAGAKRLALANKESLVAAGQLVMSEAKRMGTEIIPVDSEHCAIFQCLLSRRGSGKGLSLGDSVKRLILTASGGPFRGRSREELAAVTPERALAHPTWKMGPKITIDCATLMNKGLEVIEAARLFGVSGDRISVVVHPQSTVHSMVEYIDGATIAQLGQPDMRHCIAYAVNYPDRLPSPVGGLDLTKVGALEFYEPEWDTFPLLRLAYEALAAGGTVPAFMSGANEAAVAMFLDGKLTFPGISDAVTEAVRTYAASHHAPDSVPTLDDAIAADAAGREGVRKNHNVGKRKIQPV